MSPFFYSVFFVWTVLAFYHCQVSRQEVGIPSCLNKNSDFNSGLSDWQIYKGPGIEETAKVETRAPSEAFDSRHLFIRLPSNSKDNPTQYVKVGQYLRLSKSRRYRYTVDAKWLNSENSLNSAILSVWISEQESGTFAGKDVWLRSETKQTLTFDFSPTTDGIVDCYLSLLTHQDGFDNTDILIDNFEIQDVGPLLVEDDPRPRENLVVNGDFENGLKSWHETLNNPHRVTGLEKGLINEGVNNTLELELPGSEDPDYLNDTWLGLYQPVKLYAGNTYTISAKIERSIPERSQYPTIVNLYAMKPENHGEPAHWLGSVDYKFNRNDLHVYSQQFTPLVTGEYRVTIRVFGWGNKGRPLKVKLDNIDLRRK